MLTMTSRSQASEGIFKAKPTALCSQKSSQHNITKCVWRIYALGNYARTVE